MKAETYYIASTKYSTHERATKSGRVYDIMFRMYDKDGTEIQKKLGGFKTKTAARDAYLAFTREFCEPRPITLAIKRRTAVTAAAPTVAELVPIYINSLRNQAKDSSIYSKSNMLEHFVVEQLSNATITELTKERLREWQDILWSTTQADGEYYSYNYLSSVRACFSAFLSWIADRRDDFVNPMPKVRKPKRRVQKTEMKFWTQEQFEQFIACASDPTYRTMFYMLFYTGRRKGEVIALHCTDVTADGIRFNKTYSRKTINGAPYNITTTKNERDGRTPICEPLRAALAEYTPQEPFYFGGKKPIHENTLTHAFERYTKAAGLPPIRLHDLRHSFVSMLIHLGASMYVVADLIGDNVEQVLKTYGHLYEEDKQSIIAKIKRL